MGKSLTEYAEQHPQQVPEREREQMHRTAETIKDRQQEREQAERLKDSILQQLEQGNAPQYILYTALKAIGLLTRDPDFTEAGQGYLDSVYSDLAQQALFTDNAAIAARRLEQMQADYTGRTKADLRRRLNHTRRITEALNAALQEVDLLESAPELTGET